MFRSILAAAVCSFSCSLFAHDVGETAGLRFVYGSSPEPAITDELLNMNWIISQASSGEPSADLTDMSVSISKDGRSWGPFEPEAAYGEPGLYSTAHLFAEAGTYEATLSFKLEGADQIHSITLEAHIMDRADLVID